MLASVFVVALLGLSSTFPLSSLAMESMDQSTNVTSSKPTAQMTTRKDAANWSDPQAGVPQSGSQVPGTMVNGKCMCPATVSCGGASDPPTTPPTPTGSNTPTTTPSSVPHTNTTKNVPTSSHNTTTGTEDAPPSSGDNNSTTSGAAMTDNSPFFTGLGLIAIASLVV